MDDDELIVNEIINCEKGLLVDILDADLNLFIDNEFIKEVPVINSIYSIFKLATTINNAIFMRKLCIFIQNLPNATEKEKGKFLKKYKKDEEKFAGRLIEIIDQINDSSKCKYEAKIFEKYFYDSIDYDTFKKFSYALSKIDIDDVDEGYKMLQEKKQVVDGHIMIQNDRGSAFLSVGMADVVTFPGTCGFVFNERGKDFLNCIFE